MVKVDFLNDAGRVVGSDTTYACAEDYILPGGRKSFKLTGDYQPDYMKLRIEVERYSEVE